MASEFEIKLKKIRRTDFSNVCKALELKNQSIEMVSSALSASSFSSIDL